MFRGLFHASMKEDVNVCSDILHILLLSLFKFLPHVLTTLSSQRSRFLLTIQGVWNHSEYKPCSKCKAQVASLWPSYHLLLSTFPCLPQSNYISQKHLFYIFLGCLVPLLTVCTPQFSSTLVYLFLHVSLYADLPSFKPHPENKTSLPGTRFTSTHFCPSRSPWVTPI